MVQRSFSVETIILMCSMTVVFVPCMSEHHRKLPHHQKPSELNVLSRMVEYILVTMLQLRQVWRISQKFRESLGDCQQKHIKILRGQKMCHLWWQRWNRWTDASTCLSRLSQSVTFGHHTSYHKIIGGDASAAKWIKGPWHEGQVFVADRDVNF